MTFHRSRCAHCRAKFTPERPSQIVHLECVEGWAIAQAEKREREEAKKARAAAKVERAEIRRRKEAIKSIRELLADAQVAFNAYIRERDAHLPCVCCGKPFEPSKPGGSMDAGHYLSRGASPQHRFNEDNVFGQRKNCNRPGGTTRDAFRAGVIARIGLARVEALESDNQVPKWTREYLIELKAHYRRKLRELRSKA